jgi:D-alanyl-D-alanine carboxypeptidase
MNGAQRMSRMRPFLLAASITLVIAGTAGAQTLEQRLQSRLDSIHRAGRFPGATIGVALPDGRTIALATGVSDTARRVPMRPTDRMMAGSVGKTFFAAVATALVREGRLDLDARVSRWLGGEPWFDSLPNARDITVRQLMNHTSGVVRYEFNPRFLADLTREPMRAFTPVEELRYLFGSAAPFAAGQGWDYSDTNYIILAMIMERITGRPMYEEIRRRTLAPLALRNTVPSDSPDIEGLVQGYAGPQSDFAGVDAVLVNGRFAFNPQFEWAGGGFASTSEDLARWMKSYYEGLDADTALKRQVLDGVAAPMLGRDTRYGLGVIVRPTPLGASWGHSGFFPGYLTEVRYYPDLRIAVAMQANTSQPRTIGRGQGAIINELAGIVAEELRR